MKRGHVEYIDHVLLFPAAEQRTPDLENALLRYPSAYLLDIEDHRSVLIFEGNFVNLILKCTGKMNFKKRTTLNSEKR